MLASPIRLRVPNGFGSSPLFPARLDLAMSEPSEILREEHDVIQHLLHVLSALAGRLDRGDRVPREDLEAALEVITNFADKCHHAKEEKALFPALVRASPEEGATLIRRLEADHDAGRRLVRAMRESVPAAAAGDPAGRKAFAKSAWAYEDLLREHILVETAQLLPLIDSAIPDAERAALAREFDRIEREETGAGLHEKYEGTIHRLADKYVHATAPVR